LLIFCDLLSVQKIAFSLRVDIEEFQLLVIVTQTKWHFSQKIEAFYG